MARHVTFPATDHLVLPGLLYEPTEPTSKVAVWLHGMGDNGVFYSPKRITALAETLLARGVALLAFNNRGAHNSKVLYKDDAALPKDEQRYQAGTHYELIKDCVADIDGAADFLQTQGYETFYLAGHSTGANKICVYDALASANPFSRYVLAGPGDDSGLFYMDLGHQNFKRALTYAQKAVLSGRPTKVMPKASGLHPFSTQSAADILDPNGYYNSFPYYEATHGRLGDKPLFKEYSAITKPMLIIAGSEDEAAASSGGVDRAFDLLKNHAHPMVRNRCSFQIIAGTDHSFHGAEYDFAARVAQWLTK